MVIGKHLAQPQVRWDRDRFRCRPDRPDPLSMPLCGSPWWTGCKPGWPRWTGACCRPGCWAATPRWLRFLRARREALGLRPGELAEGRNRCGEINCGRHGSFWHHLAGGIPVCDPCWHAEEDYIALFAARERCGCMNRAPMLFNGEPVAHGGAATMLAMAKSAGVPRRLIPEWVKRQVKDDKDAGRRLVRPDEKGKWTSDLSKTSWRYWDADGQPYHGCANCCATGDCWACSPRFPDGYLPQEDPDWVPAIPDLIVHCIRYCICPNCLAKIRDYQGPKPDTWTPTPVKCGGCKMWVRDARQPVQRTLSGPGITVKDWNPPRLP